MAPKRKEITSIGKSKNPNSYVDIPAKKKPPEMTPWKTPKDFLLVRPAKYANITAKKILINKLGSITAKARCGSKSLRN